MPVKNAQELPYTIRLWYVSEVKYFQVLPYIWFQSLPHVGSKNKTNLQWGSSPLNYFCAAAPRLFSRTRPWGAAIFCAPVLPPLHFPISQQNTITTLRTSIKDKAKKEQKQSLVAAGVRHTTAMTRREVCPVITTDTTASLCEVVLIMTFSSEL